MTKVSLDMDLKYLNSASTKMLCKFFEALERAAAKGRPIEVQWCYESDDTMLGEFGEDLRDNFPNLDVQLAAYSGIKLPESHRNSGLCRGSGQCLETRQRHQTVQLIYSCASSANNVICATRAGVPRVFFRE